MSPCINICWVATGTCSWWEGFYAKEELFSDVAHLYCPIRNFIKHVFCLFAMAGFVQKSFDSILSMLSFSSHLCCVWLAIIVKLCSLSNLKMCLLRCLMGPLSGVCCIECHQSFCRYVSQNPHPWVRPSPGGEVGLTWICSPPYSSSVKFHSPNWNKHNIHNFYSKARRLQVFKNTLLPDNQH